MTSRLALGAIFLTTVVGAPLARAATYTVLHTFSGYSTDGANPAGGLIADANFNVYGTTYEGGAADQGTVFEWAADGPETVLYSFTGLADGGGPEAGLVLGPNGSLYGTTYFGGAYDYGVVFELTPPAVAGGAWTEAVLYSFTGGPDGGNPWAGLTLGSNGVFYGTTTGGGLGVGVAFILTPPTSPNGPWTETVLHNFGAFTGDGANPYASWTFGTNGVLYGATESGGSSGYGIVFSLTTGGVLTVLHPFTGGADGGNPQAGFALDSAGNFYGTTPYGGAGYGVAFKMTEGGTFTLLHTFTGGTDGAYPFAGLIYSIPDLYGVTYFGGASGGGTLFKMTTAGVKTVQHNFAAGQYPFGSLVKNSAGTYGTTYYGGSSTDGQLFSLSTVAGPSIETAPASGNVGTAVTILGINSANLTGATSVTFNGTPAAFTVVSSSEITTTVPVGATSGTVEVVTPSRTLSSDAPFQVP